MRILLVGMLVAYGVLSGAVMARPSVPKKLHGELIQRLRPNGVLPASADRFITALLACPDCQKLVDGLMIAARVESLDNLADSLRNPQAWLPTQDIDQEVIQVIQAYGELREFYTTLAGEASGDRGLQTDSWQDEYLQASRQGSAELLQHTRTTVDEVIAKLDVRISELLPLSWAHQQVASKPDLGQNGIYKERVLKMVSDPLHQPRNISELVSFTPDEQQLLQTDHGLAKLHNQYLEEYDRRLREQKRLDDDNLLLTLVALDMMINQGKTNEALSAEQSTQSVDQLVADAAAEARAERGIYNTQPSDPAPSYDPLPVSFTGIGSSHETTFSHDTFATYPMPGYNNDIPGVTDSVEIPDLPF